ncbi:MAG: hypothetical protein HY673_06600 [Chloroflexi bacterium]|nr:hypothetical protein [Chloroflexota bacterium]
MGNPDTTLQDVKHTWDSIGNLTKRETRVTDSRWETESFAYDFLDRLTSQTGFLFSFGDSGNASSRVSTPYKAAVDSSGNIWVADWDNARIAKYNAEGSYANFSFGHKHRING